MEEYNVPVGVRNGSGHTELLIVLFIPDVSENKNLFHISFTGAFSGLFSSFCPSFHQPNVAAPPPPLRVRNLQKARSEWLSSPCQLQTLRSLHSGGQSTKVKVVSDRLKADLETQNSLSHLENIKGTCHCYCGHALKLKVRKNTTDLWRGRLRRKWTVPGFFFLTLLLL